MQSRKPAKTTRRAVLFNSLAALAGRSASAAEPKIVVPPYNTITDEEEIVLGNAFADELAKEYNLLEDRLVEVYCTKLVREISKRSLRPDMPYRVQVVNTGVVNASALPGGRIFLNRGLIHWARNEAELASVVAHEVGHVVGRHGTNRLSRMAMAKGLYEDLKRSMGVSKALVVEVLEIMGGPLAVLAQMQYSRQAESEADLLAVYNMQRCGWHPRHAADSFARLGGADRGAASNLLEQLFEVVSTHPATSNRAAAIRREMASMPNEGGADVYNGEFARIKARCEAMPPPPKPKRQD